MAPKGSHSKRKHRGGQKAQQRHDKREERRRQRSGDAAPATAAGPAAGGRGEAAARPGARGAERMDSRAARNSPGPKREIKLRYGSSTVTRAPQAGPSRGAASGFRTDNIKRMERDDDEFEVWTPSARAPAPRVPI